MGLFVLWRALWYLRSRQAFCLCCVERGLETRAGYRAGWTCEVFGSPGRGAWPVPPVLLWRMAKSFFDVEMGGAGWHVSSPRETEPWRVVGRMPNPRNGLKLESLGNLNFALPKHALGGGGYKLTP